MERIHTLSRRFLLDMDTVPLTTVLANMLTFGVRQNLIRTKHTDYLCKLMKHIQSVLFLTVLVTVIERTLMKAQKKMNTPSVASKIDFVRFF